MNFGFFNPFESSNGGSSGGTIDLSEYAKKEDLVGLKTTEGGEIFNDYENNIATTNSHAEGSGTKASSENQHVQGKYNIEDSENKYAFIIGNGEDDDNRSNALAIDWNGLIYINNNENGYDLSTFLTIEDGVGQKTADGGEIFNDYTNNIAHSNSHAEGYKTKATGKCAHAEGGNVSDIYSTGPIAEGEGSHAEGYSSVKAYGNGSHAEGRETTAGTKIKNDDGTITYGGDYSHAEGQYTTASGNYSHAEGNGARALGNGSHAEGGGTASGNYSHAEGGGTTASGLRSHAEGSNTKASGDHSHAEGQYTTASGNYSHAEGNGTLASGQYSHAEGSSTKASSDFQHVQGKCNVEDTNGKYAFIIGNGKNNNKRSNAFAIDWDGLIYLNNSDAGIDLSEISGEVTQARTDANGTTYATLKERLDSADENIKSVKNYLENFLFYNIVDCVEVIEGYYVNAKNGGTFDNLSVFHCTDYIYIHNFSKIKVNRTFHYGSDGLAFYDKYKKYISGYAEKTGDKYVVLDVPSNAYYVRFSSFKHESLELFFCCITKELYEFEKKLSTQENYIKEVANSDVLGKEVANPILADISSAILDANSKIVDDTIVYNYTGTGNSWWSFIIDPLKTKNNIVNISFEITEIGEGHKVGNGLIFKNTDGETIYYNLKMYSQVGKYENTIDLNYLVVYKGLDINQTIRMYFNNITHPTYCVYKNPILYSNVTLLDTDKNLGENLNDMYTSIESNTSDIEQLKSKESGVMVSPNGSKFLMQISDNGEIVAVPKIPSNILYIGNSLLLGFGTFGMAASNSNEDYYHYINEYLEPLVKTLTTSRLQGSGYEGTKNESEQDAWLNGTLLPKLNDSLQLVIIQLGDNVNTTEKQSAFENGSKKMIRFIRQHAPNARVAWVGEWYGNTVKQGYISNACIECGATFVNIGYLPSIEGNKSYVGSIYTDDNGVEHEITSSGVASHPSSQGMRAIADTIISELFE